MGGDELSLSLDDAAAAAVRSHPRTEGARRATLSREEVSQHAPRGERPTIARTAYTRALLRFGAAVAREARGVCASSVLVLKRPSARRGPGIVSVDRNVRSKCRCSCVLQFTS